MVAGITHLALRATLAVGMVLAADGGARDWSDVSAPAWPPVSAVAARPQTYVLTAGEAGAAPVYPVPPGLNFIFPLRY